MVKKTIIMCFFMINLIFLSSCWGKMDVDQLSITAALGVDKSEEGFKVTAQVVNTESMKQQGGSSNLPSVVVYSEEGETVFEAIRKLTTRYPARLFIAHFDILFIGEEMAREGILPASIFLYTDHEARHKYKIAIVKNGTAEEILKIKTPMSKIPAIEINKMLISTGKSYGVSTEYYMDEILTRIQTTGEEMALCTVEIVGDIKEGSENKNIEALDIKTYIHYTNLSVFHKDKLIGFLSMEEAQGYSHLQNRIVSAIETVDYKEVKLSYEIKDTKLKTTFQIVDGKPVFDMIYDISGSIASITNGQTYFTYDEINEIESLVIEKIKLKMEQCIETSKTYGSDIVGFGRQIYQQDLKYWKTIEEDYQNVYKEMKINIQVNVSVNTKGY